MIDRSVYIDSPGARSAVTHLKEAVTIDSAIVIETIMNILDSGGNAAEAVIACDEASSSLTAIADPCGCAVADGIKE